MRWVIIRLSFVIKVLLFICKLLLFSCKLRLRVSDVSFIMKVAIFFSSDDVTLGIIRESIVKHMKELCIL